MASRFADINSVEQFIEDQENENTRENSTEYKEIEFISSFWMFYDHSSFS